MDDLERYRGGVALVTGAGDGIGRMLAHGFAAASLTVCVQDIREDAAQRVASEIGGSAFPLAFDVSDRQAPLSVLWINAGVGAASPVVTGRREIVEWAFGVNVLGAIWTAQAFRPLMDHDGARHVGVTASSAALRPPDGEFPLYAATKHGAFAVAEALRGELARDGIGTTILCPGLLNTDIWDAARARPARFGGPRSMDPAIATRWREAKDPQLMWPHVARCIARGGGYLVCATDGGQTKAAFEERAARDRRVLAVTRVRLPAALLVSLVASIHGCISWTEDQRSALQAADKWLEELEAGNADALWEQTSALVHSRFEQEFRTKEWIGARRPFGALISREAILNWSVTYLYGAPDGDYREVGYSSEFENADAKIDESVWLSREDGAWKVLRYEIDYPGSRPVR